MKVEGPSNSSRLRISVTVVIVLMVISSPVLVYINPVLVVAKSTNNIDTSSQHSGFSLKETSTPLASPTNVSPLDSDFTTQAALSSLSARPTNNIVNTNSFYDVIFLTATAGAIKTIQVTFPAGTTIPSGAFFNEAEGIGAGTASKSGQTITYTVTNAVNVPASTKIRLEFANINNPLNPSANYQVTVTTRNAANTPIDGPTQSTAYTMKQIGKNAVAESFMKRVTVLDDAAGHAVGWDPNGAQVLFLISDPEASNPNTTYISATVLQSGDLYCFAAFNSPGEIEVLCQSPPSDGAPLQYLVTNLPAHVVS